MSSSRSGETGSASIWLLCAGAVVLFMATVINARTAAVLGRHRAEGAADLSALAAAAQIGLGANPCGSAARVARANGASLQMCRTELDAAGRSGVVTVWVAASVRLAVVGRRSVVASAWAGRVPVEAGASETLARQ